MIKIFHDWSADDFSGQPWPPPGEGWVIVRRNRGVTSWRLIELEADPPQSVLVNARAANQAKWRRTQMKRDDIFQGKYLKVVDLKGKARIATIVTAPLETLKGLDGKENQKIVLYLENVKKSLPLNATNFDAVCDATGHFDTDDWPGQQIELYPARTTMGGKPVDCIRIRRPSASRPQVAAPPPPDNEGADEIPW